MAGFGDAFKSAMAKADATAQRAAGAVATGAKWVGKQSEAAAEFSKSAVSKVDGWVAEQVKKAVKTTGEVIDTAGLAAMAGVKQLPASWQAPAEDLIAGGVGLATLATEAAGNAVIQRVSAEALKINAAIDEANAKVGDVVRTTVGTVEKIHKAYKEISKAATDKAVAAAKAICEAQQAAKERLRKRYEEGLQNAAARRLKKPTEPKFDIGVWNYQRDGRSYKSTNPEERGVAKKGETAAKLGISSTEEDELLYFGDDDNNIRIGTHDTSYLAGHKKTKDGTETGLSASKSFSALKAKGTKEFGKYGEVESEIEILSGDLAVGASVVRTAEGTKVVGEVGGEANLIKGAIEGRINLTPSAVYKRSVGRVLGKIRPGLAELPDKPFFNKGIYVSSKAEGGVGAAAKATATFDTNKKKIEFGAKAGFGLFGGLTFGVGVVEDKVPPQEPGANKLKGLP